MKIKSIFAVKRENLTDQDEIRLLDLEGAEFVSYQAFCMSVRSALYYGDDHIHRLLGTLKEIIYYARKNADFNIDDYITINVVINYER